MKKQDLNGVRTPLDVERRHKLGAITGLEKDVGQIKQDIVADSQLSASSTNSVQNKVVTEALNSLDDKKVDKVVGKKLTTNDFDNYYKNRVDNMYPINSIYLSTLEISLQTLSNMYGGIWEQGENIGTYFTYKRKE